MNGNFLQWNGNPAPTKGRTHRVVANHPTRGKGPRHVEQNRLTQSRTMRNRRAVTPAPLEGRGGIPWRGLYCTATFLDTVPEAPAARTT